MKVISEKAGLSRSYTNHCLRVTAVSVLYEKGVEALDICSVSRHRHTDSLKSYSKGPSDRKRYEMSRMLHQHGKVPSSYSQPDSAVSSTSYSHPVPSTSNCHLNPRKETQLINVDDDVDDMALVAASEMCESSVNDDNNVTLVKSQSEYRVLKSVFAGAVFQSGSAPVFNFNGNFNLC